MHVAQAPAREPSTRTEPAGLALRLDWLSSSLDPSTRASPPHSLDHWHGQQLPLTEGLLLLRKQRSNESPRMLPSGPTCVSQHA